MANEIEMGWDDSDQAPRRPRARYNWRKDPVATTLVWTMVVVLVLALTGGLYAALSYKSYRPVVRTQEEKELAVLEQNVRTNPKDARSWYDLAGMLVSVGQFNKADSALERAEAALGKLPAFDVQRARILFAKGRYESAAAEAREARKAAYVAEKKAVEAQRGKGYAVTVEGYKDDVIIDASILIAEAETELGNLGKAIEAYTDALDEDPRMADILAVRGDLYEKDGQDAKAAADYQGALKFVPDMQMALDGLERVKRGSK